MTDKAPPSPAVTDTEQPVRSGRPRARLNARLGEARRANWRDGKARMVVWACLSGILIAGLVSAINAVPRKTRIRLETKVGSFFTSAPVLMIGDSLAYVSAPRDLCGKPMFNAAVPGDTIANLLVDAPDYARRLAAGTVVIAVGVNDAWPSHMAIQSWTKDYRKLLAHYAGHDLVLVEIYPPDLAIQGFVQRLDLAFIAEANAVIRALGAEAGARVVPAPDWVHTKDGLHPAGPGIEVWRERLVQTACI